MRMFPVVYLWPVEILSPTAGWAAVRGGGEGLWASGGVKRAVTPDHGEFAITWNLALVFFPVCPCVPFGKVAEGSLCPPQKLQGSLKEQSAMTRSVARWMPDGDAAAQPHVHWTKAQEVEGALGDPRLFRGVWRGDLRLMIVGRTL
ncbi:hypothetical protein BKA64DRAFT_644663 [Cadophora sp. MPI-SDFR-AT-0126]|nr:hypothetical protein BKA64DRAFT_644663 [Leotiomycetes sp. MPI-SDFR-AT-0126]